MVRAIDTIGQAARHGMVIRAECQGCGNIRYYMASDMMSVYGGGRDIRSLKFKCGSCQPKPVQVEVLEIDYDRMPRINVYKPTREPFTGTVKWTSRRFKG